MKRELTLTDIAGYLEHPLLGQHPSGNICWIDVEFIAQHGIAMAGYKPVLRPMSDLYKEITDKDYNGGEPFVPIVELAKARHPNFEQYILHPSEYYVYLSIPSIIGDYTEEYAYHEKQLSIEELDLLHQLKLDYRGLIDVDMAVNVHDLKQNPYEK